MKKSNNNTRGRGRGGVQHVLPSNIFTTQSSNSNTSVFNESQHSFKSLVNDTSEENINNAIQQLNNWNIANNQTENMWDRQRVIKWVQTRTRDNRLTREKRERNN
ncbi:unnamed protein product [Rhizophagus irregularis]|nr:unnamed protein product [Rhizophagus irregularis]CAB5374186.1 unnamed protein product [Rhizophagus irregularis]